MVPKVLAHLLDGIEIESFISLDCIVEKSATTLRLTSDPKRGRQVALFWAAFGSAICLVLILFAPSSQDAKGVLIAGGIGIFWLITAFLIGSYRIEIEFDLSCGRIFRRRYFLGRVCSISALPFDQLWAIRAVEASRGGAGELSSSLVGELILVRADKKTFWGENEVWVCWQFPTESEAAEVRDEIRAWLERYSPYPLPSVD